MNLAPGTRVRITVDDPFDTGLRAGDVCTILFAREAEVDGTRVVAVNLQSHVGEVCLPVGVLAPVEPSQAPEPGPADYAPAEPDEVVDGIFERMMRSDLELFTLAMDAGTLLDEQPPARPRLVEVDDEDDEDAEDDEDGTGSGWSNDEEDPHSSLTITDGDGDRALLVYAERICPTHKIREGAVFLRTEGGSVVAIPAHQLAPFIEWLQDREKHARRPQPPTSES